MLKCGKLLPYIGHARQRRDFLCRDIRPVQNTLFNELINFAGFGEILGDIFGDIFGDILGDIFGDIR